MNIYDNTVFKPNEVGIIDGLPMRDYREAPGVAGSDMESLLRNPSAYRRGDRMNETEEMKFGTLMHSLLFSGNADYYTAPETYLAPETAKKGAPMIQKAWNWNANFCKEWAESHSDKPIIPRDGNHSAYWLKAMCSKIEAHPIASRFLSRLSPEVSVFARHAEYPLLLKGRLDGFIRGETTIIVELKTTRDASTSAFSREIFNRGYYKKAAWYRMLLHQVRVSPVEFWYIAVEKSDRPRVNVRKLAERAMDKGDLDNDDALKFLMQCKHANHWPELPDEPVPGSNMENPTIDLPDYSYGASVDDLLGLSEITEDVA